MHLYDIEMTAFWSPKGIFCCQVMPFSLKNVGATYQRAIAVIFKKMLEIQAKTTDFPLRNIIKITTRRSLWRRNSHQTRRGLEDPVLDISGIRSTSRRPSQNNRSQEEVHQICSPKKWRFLDGILLWCIVNQKIYEAISEVQSRICGAH